MANQIDRFDAEDFVGWKEPAHPRGGLIAAAGDNARVAPANSARAMLAHSTSFWLLALLLGLLLFAASAPSPLYGVYQAMWHFSPITLTAIYAMYALSALAASITTGRLSDHLGRRPVLLIALVVQLAGMLAFVAARGVATLFLGRFLQGLGTGMASGAISAWLLDLHLSSNPRLGSVVGSIAPLAGLASGASGSGLLVQYGPDPLHLVFWLLIALYALAFALMFVVPDVAERRPGWLQSMSPVIGVPPTARSMFGASAPSLIAIWALGGLYLSLGPSLAISLLRSNSHLAGGLVIVALMGAAALAAVLLRAAEPRAMVTRGSLVLIGGVGITLLAVAASSTFGLFAGSLIAGVGFGPAFSAMFRSLAFLAPPDRRSALLSAIFLIVFVSFGVPAVIAGVAVTRIGLRDTTYAYGLAVMGLATLTTLAMSRTRGLARI